MPSRFRGPQFRNTCGCFAELNPEPLRAVDFWIEQYRVFWTASLNNLKAFVEAEHARETEEASRKPK
jgi:hypothetical protein